MTNAEKLTMVKTLLDDGTGYLPSDETLNTYIQAAQAEILAWIYHLVGGVPESVTEVPSKYDMTHVYAVVAGYTHAGAEGQEVHIENGVHRHFMYADMLGYIHNNVLAIVRVGAIS